MENLGHYLNIIKNWFKEGWKFLFEDTEKIRAHHLIAFLLTIIIIYLLSYIIARLFKTLLMICILIAVFWILYMLIFDRRKFRELFSKESYKKGSENTGNNDD